MYIEKLVNFKLTFSPLCFDHGNLAFCMYQRLHTYSKYSSLGMIVFDSFYLGPSFYFKAENR